MRPRTQRGSIMAPARQRRAQNMRVEAPIGGWNTRDSVDNIPPTDAISLINWIPDLGEVRTRPGYTEHCWVGDVVTGSNLVSNPGFEDAGGGGADVFANWTENATGGYITRSTVFEHGGTYSCGLNRFTTSVNVSQNITTTASTTYTLKFWVYSFRNLGKLNHINYKVYDVSNSADLIAKVEATGVEDSWTEIIVQFTTAVGGISTGIWFYADDNPGGVYVDDVSVYAALAEDDVETLAEYISGSDRMLIAAASGAFIDATTASSPSDITQAATTHDLDKWQWANFDGKIGFVNGTDKPQQWAGAGLMTDLDIQEVDAGGGLDDENIIGINVFKNRTWFWEDGSQDVWYSALNTLGGDCTKFPMSRVGQFGGELIAMVTWTRDGGSGPDDFAVFIMSSGEAIIYQGSSPALGGDWAIVGVYDIGEPLSVRSIVKFGGDVFIITRLDYVNLSQVIPGAEAYRDKSKVVRALRDAIGTGGAIWGWEAQVYPKRQLAIFNHPVTAGTEYEQHVMNTVTGAWCRFTGITSHTWQAYASRMFFGSTSGYVYEFDTSQSDAGTAIESEFQTSWLPLGGYGNKSFIAIREFTVANTDINTENQYVVDYEIFSDQVYPVSVTSGFAEWGDPWGTPWSAADAPDKDWEMVGLYGEVLSTRKRLSTKQRVKYLGASWLYEAGERL